MVHVAPRPAFGATERTDDRVRGGGEMRQRVGVRRVLATTDVTARKADAERDPLFAERRAFVATLRRGGGIVDRREVLAALAGFGGAHRLEGPHGVNPE